MRSGEIVGNAGRTVVRRMRSLIRRLFSPRLHARTQSAWDPNRFVYVRIPGDIPLLTRVEMSQDPLQLALAEAGPGNVPPGGVRISFCGVDIPARNRGSARNWLMRQLIKLAAPNGTEILYTKDGVPLLDRLVDGTWIVGKASSSDLRSDLMKSSRSPSYSYRHPDGIRVLIEFRLERSCEIAVGFRRLLRAEFDAIAKHIAISNPKTVEVLLKQHIGGQRGSTVQQSLNTLSQSGGQLVTIVHFVRLDPRPPEPKVPALAMTVHKT